MKKISTVRFGELEVDEAKLVRFADGIPAFEDEHEFAIIPCESDSPYAFLQSAKTPDLAFLMAHPHVFFPEYEFQLDDGAARALGIETADDILLYVFITIPGGRIEDMTANLMAPIVVSGRTFRARQVVLDQGGYTTKHRLFPAKEEK